MRGFYICTRTISLKAQANTAAEIRARACLDDCDFVHDAWADLVPALKSMMDRDAESLSHPREFSGFAPRSPAVIDITGSA